MAVLAGVFAVLAALLHVAIFAMESVLWTRPAVYRRCGVASEADAAVLASTGSAYFRAAATQALFAVVALVLLVVL